MKSPGLEFYPKIREDLAWLGCKVDEEYIQSDRIPIYYEYAETTNRRRQRLRLHLHTRRVPKENHSKEPCPCRNLPAAEHLERWKHMLDGSYAEGEAVVRVKTDLNHPNPAVRDWPALRIIDTKKYPHPRVGSKYRVWPLYNLAAGLDDHLLGHNAHHPRQRTPHQRRPTRIHVQTPGLGIPSGNPLRQTQNHRSIPEQIKNRCKASETANSQDGMTHGWQHLQLCANGE